MSKTEDHLTGIRAARYRLEAVQDELDALTSRLDGIAQSYYNDNRKACVGVLGCSDCYFKFLDIVKDPAPVGQLDFTQPEAYFTTDCSWCGSGAGRLRVPLDYVESRL